MTIADQCHAEMHALLIRIKNLPHAKERDDILWATLVTSADLLGVKFITTTPAKKDPL